jgi:hypothetical protein
MVAKQIFIRTQKCKLGCYKSYPLKMNLVLEIRMDQRDVDTLLSTPPVFPKLPHPLHDYSIAPCTS